MAELFNLIPSGTFFGRQRHSHLPKETADQQSGSIRSYVLSSPVTYVHHSLESLRSVAEATVIPRWLVRSDSNRLEPDRPTNLRALARLSKLEADLANTTKPRDRRRIEKEIYALKYDPLEEAERRLSLFDVERVRTRLRALETARDADDLPRMVSLIRNQVSRDAGGMCNPQLYERPGVKAEPVIHRYQKTVAEVLNRIVTACRNDDSRIDKYNVAYDLRETCDSFGRTALLCSGGGTMGMMHIGVIKALFEANRLPRIVCGSSAGAIVCAILCTRTDIELPQVLEEFSKGDLDVFVGRKEGCLTRLRYFLQNWCLYDSNNLARVMKRYLGDMTFAEAHSRSGKILNITVSRLGDDGKSEVLNHVTQPNVTIWSAVVASCALPGIYKPAQLFMKDPVTRALEPMPSAYMDGSIQGDIPLQQLMGLFNCSYFIVAQANPHVLFYQQMRKQLGSGPIVRSFEKLCSIAIEEYAQVLPLSGLGWMGEFAFSVMRQSYTGDVTIVPQLTLTGIMRVLQNPTQAFIEASTSLGESLTSDFLPMVKNHTKIELALQKAYRDVNEAIHFGRSQSDLRRSMQQQSRTGRPRRSGSTQSMPGLHAVTYKIGGVNLLGERSTTWDYSSDDANPHAAKFEIDSDDSDELDADSMTSLTPPMDVNDDDSDADMETEPVKLQSYSAPASPRPRSLSGSPVQSRSRSPAFSPNSLLMTPSTVGDGRSRKGTI